MNSILEKEKKLNLTLTKLKNLNLKNPKQSGIEDLNQKKNQLEIEKKELEDKYWLLKEDLEKKYKSLMDDYNNLSLKLDEIKNHEKIEQKKQIEFSEKIDELNQETDTLIQEIDKWQM